MEGKIITCCGDCVHYNWKKSKCRNGHNDNSNPRKHFYSDCKTLLDLEEHDRQIKADTIDECISKIDTLDSMSFGLVTIDVAKGTLEALKESR